LSKLCFEVIKKGESAIKPSFIFSLMEAISSVTCLIPSLRLSIPSLSPSRSAIPQTHLNINLFFPSSKGYFNPESVIKNKIVSKGNIQITLFFSIFFLDKNILCGMFHMFLIYHIFNPF